MTYRERGGVPFSRPSGRGCYNMNGIQSVVPEGYYTRAQVATMIGRSVTVLRRMERDGSAIPSATMRCGQINVHLYSKEDVRLAKRAVRHRRSGPKSSGITRGSKNQ